MAQLKPMVSKRFIMLGTLSVVLLALPTAADAFTVDEATELPAQQRALVFARVLADEKGLIERAGDIYTVVIASRRGKAASEACAKEMLAGFELLQAKKIGGVPLQFVAAVLNSPTDIAKLDEAQNVDAIYVCGGFSAAEAQGIVSMALGRRIITLADRYPYLKSGVTMGLFVVDGKPRIVWSTAALSQLALAFGPTATRYALAYSE